MFSFQGAFFELLIPKRLNEISTSIGISVNLFIFYLKLFYLLSFLSGGPKWTRTIDLTIISRVL